MKLSAAALLLVASASPLASGADGGGAVTVAHYHNFLRRALGKGKKGEGSKPKQPKTPKKPKTGAEAKAKNSKMVDPSSIAGRASPAQSSSILSGETANPEGAANMALNRVPGQEGCDDVFIPPGQMIKHFYAVPQVKGKKIYVKKQDACTDDCQCAPCYCCFTGYSRDSVCIQGVDRDCTANPNLYFDDLSETAYGYCCDLTSHTKKAARLGPYTMDSCPNDPVTVTKAIHNGCTRFTLARMSKVPEPQPPISVIGGQGNSEVDVVGQLP